MTENAVVLTVFAVGMTGLVLLVPFDKEQQTYMRGFAVGLWGTAFALILYWLLHSRWGTIW